MKFKAFPIVLICFFFIGCKKEIKNKMITDATIEAESTKANEFFAAYFEEYKTLRPQFQTQLGSKENYGKWDDISHLFETAELERAKKYATFIKDSLDYDLLDENTSLSYDLFKLEMENIIANYEFRFHNYPVNQMFGLHSGVPAFLINMHKIDSLEDAEAYLSRLEGIKPLFNQLIENLQLREKNGIVAPKFVFEKVIDDSKNILKGLPFEKESINESALLNDFSTKINKTNVDNETKKKLIDKARNYLINYVQPAYLSLIEFLENQEKRATIEDGAWKFPKGDKFYANALKNITTTKMTADEIHQLGLSEVKRIHSEMEAILKTIGFEGTLQDFFSFMRTDKQFYYPDTEEGKEKYLKEATALINTMKGRLDELFLTKPKAEIVVKAVESFREKSAGKAFYQRPASDGTRPGTYYANLYQMNAMPTYQMEALAYHEGIPGHHMQIAIAQELKGIPDFRKFKNYTAYVEGWGLYSEYFPKEIGFYADPYSDFGRLAMELWRACRLVVDTGIHSKKWTRQEGINYYKENTPNAESDCVKMVERHIVMPGQATAYKIGMIKILQLREQAKEKLGDTFDIREFHDVILTNGSLPLNILENKVNAWIALKQK
ncbi:MAG: DUF885 domain-containing protein [Flavobacteriaceae bacterium CG02_land_8_20_14_3_00_34_13]|nr:DUF885 domain-containing protein [Flavobacteriia bacterium]PIV49448.1 MAG: DUF885 domain-containing protein [Flavobacteriaceae bacterium CG02_land_8_20_14_3_00_34_13]PJC08400.1 MAG: DUF885 domain-containing protein [Flavobacteriaceae bacterium CG_4_9_14_0_8_um_filter_34_30]